MNLGTKLISLRKTYKLSQTQLSINLNEKCKTDRFDKGRMSKWENDIHVPDVYSIKILAEYYNISIDDLLDNNKSDNVNSRILDENKKLQKQINVMKDTIKNIRKLTNNFHTQNINQK